MNIPTKASRGAIPTQPFDEDGPNPIEVVTRDLDNPESVTIKQIDYSNRSDRKWLSRHQHYCLTHRKSFTTFQV